VRINVDGHHFHRSNFLKINQYSSTWLNNPQRRFTVINDIIIRLGESVDGFRLTRIEKDNRKWLLKFNRRNYSKAMP